MSLWLLLAAVTLAGCGQRVGSQQVAVQPAAPSPSAPTVAMPLVAPSEREGAAPTPPASEPDDGPTSPIGGAAEEPPEPHGSALWGRSFTSVAVTEAGQPKPLVSGTSIRVDFERRDDGGVVRWSSSCNTFGARVVATADRLQLESESLGGTAVGCDEQRHEQDGWVTGFFSSDPHWRLEGDRLVLLADDDVIELRETESASDGS